MSPVAIGARNIRGTIQGVTSTTEPSGYETLTPGDLATTPVEWVQIIPSTGSEFMQGQQVFGALTARLTMRYRNDLTEQMQFITDDGDVWQFQSPPMDPDGRRRELEILVTKVANISIKGDVALVAKFRQLSDAMKGDALVTAAQVGAEKVTAESTRIVPVDTGIIRGTITSEPASSTPTRAMVNIGYGSEAPYGRYVELGTSRMAAQPFLRPALVTQEAEATRVVGESFWRVIEATAR